MTEELKQQIKIHYHDELRDEREYKSMAELLMPEHPKIAKIFIDLGNEEKSHAHLIEHILKDLNIE